MPDTEDNSNFTRKTSDLPQYPLLGHTDHTPFTAEPHPLITSEELSSRSSFASSSKPADPSSKSLYGWAKFSTPIMAGGGERKEVAPIGEDDHEYFSELTDNINRKNQYPNSPTVSGFI